MVDANQSVLGSKVPRKGKRYAESKFKANQKKGVVSKAKFNNHNH